MYAARQCRECGAEVSAGPPLEDLYPRCLLLLGLGAEPGKRKKIGEYEVLPELTRGTMGAVYRAHKTPLKSVA